MRSFAEAYPDFPIVQVPLAQITWYHHISLISKVKDERARAFYILETLKNDWSRDIMMLQIKNKLYERSGKLINNFEKTLPDYQSELAQEVFKDPYNFDFLNLSTELNEREIESQLTKKITDFLLELGKGFAFVGSQYPLDIDETDYFIDMLFYHTILHCYVVVELKAGDFKPEYISKLNFYINAVDDKIKQASDGATIGLLLCAGKSDIKVEYSMRGLNKPLGVAEYELEKIVRKSFKELEKE